MGRWVAVAYDDNFYVGKIMSLKSEEEIRVDFLTQKNDGSFKWPRPKDSDKVSAKYIFCSTPRVQQVGTIFAVSQLDSIKHLYKVYHKKFMTEQ